MRLFANEEDSNFRWQQIQPVERAIVHGAVAEEGDRRVIGKHEACRQRPGGQGPTMRSCPSGRLR